MNINDEKLAALKALGYTTPNSVVDAEYAFYRDNGSSSDSLVGAMMEWLAAQGITSGTVNDRWYTYLGGLGYTGSLADRLLAFWAAGGPSVGGSAASEPTASLAGGTYDRAMTQAISLSTASVGASIYYTLDGSTPTTSSTLYTGAIPVDSTTTIKAIASGGGFTDSTVFSATYTIIAPQLYIPCNGFNTGTSFVDCSGYAKTVTTVGDAKTSTAHGFNSTGSSALFDGTTDALSLAFSSDLVYGTGDFVIAVKFRLTVAGVAQIIYDYRSGGGAEISPVLLISSSNALEYYTGGATRITGGSLTTGVDYVATVSRVSGTTRLVLNGSQVGSDYADSNDYVAPSGMKIGARRIDNVFSFNGYIAQFWSHKGAGISVMEALAWYNANVAFAPHPNALYHFDGADGGTTMTDSSNRAATTTVNGSAQLDTALKVFGTASALLDGNDDYIYQTGAASPAFSLGSADFTIYWWGNKPGDGVTSYDGVVSVDPSAGSGIGGWCIENSAARGLGRLWSGGFTQFTSANPNTSAWIAYKISRVAGTTKAFTSTDGITYTEVYSGADTNVYVAGTALYIGRGAAGGAYYNGSVDELAIVQGMGDHSTAVPTRPFVA